MMKHSRFIMLGTLRQFPQQFDAKLKSTMAKLGKTITEAGIRVD